MNRNTKPQSRALAQLRSIRASAEYGTFQRLLAHEIPDDRQRDLECVKRVAKLRAYELRRSRRQRVMA